MHYAGISTFIEFDGSFNRTFPTEDNSNSPNSSKSFGEAQLDLLVIILVVYE